MLVIVKERLYKSQYYKQHPVSSIRCTDKDTDLYKTLSLLVTMSSNLTTTVSNKVPQRIKKWRNPTAQYMETVSWTQ